MILQAILAIGVLLPATIAVPVDVNKGNGTIWAVLVAGSNTYGNYRHQADVCHAYQIFHRHGIPDSNIIVMMFDDIARNSENPKKGVIINKPGGPNVYVKVPKDYTGNDVTPKNFVHVLTGNKEALNGVGSGKVLKSGPNDHVFVNFVDHGGPGVIGFPNDYMYADDLIKALQTMHKQKMYKKLLFYMEACESGSMFNNRLPKDIDIIATTAANPHESSYACYWDDTVEAYLGDEFSVAWMEDIDSEEHHANLTTETIVKQYKNVVSRVSESHPKIYGEKTLQKDRVVDFLGVGKSATYYSGSEKKLERFQDVVSSRDVALHTLNRRIVLNKDIAIRTELEKKRDYIIKGRKVVDELFGRVLARLPSLTVADLKRVESSRTTLSQGMMPCYRTLVDNFSRFCVNINKNTYALGHLYKLANLCSIEYFSTDELLENFNSECTEDIRALDGVN